MFKYLLAVITGIVMLYPSGAEASTLPPAPLQPSVLDTTGIEDTVKPVPAPVDPKQEFRKELQETALTFGITRDQLAPEMDRYLERFSRQNGNYLSGVRRRGEALLQIMGGILQENGLPADLKYLAVIESNLVLSARSKAGAVGPWQLMPETARNLGLKVGHKYDERKDVAKSTRAACKYLNDLYGLYHDWLLVIAAYNSGPGRVNQAIRKCGSSDFWVLEKFLPLESQKHVRRFIATQYTIEGQLSQLALAKKEADPAGPDTVPDDSASAFRTQTISGRFLGSVVAKHLNMEMIQFNKLNPDFDRSIALKGSYVLTLTAGKMEIFEAEKNRILDESFHLLLDPAGN